MNARPCCWRRNSPDYAQKTRALKDRNNVKAKIWKTSRRSWRTWKGITGSRAAGASNKSNRKNARVSNSVMNDWRNVLRQNKPVNNWAGSCLIHHRPMPNWRDAHETMLTAGRKKAKHCVIANFSFCNRKKTPKPNLLKYEKKSTPCSVNPPIFLPTCWSYVYD